MVNVEIKIQADRVALAIDILTHYLDRLRQQSPNEILIFNNGLIESDEASLKYNWGKNEQQS